MNIQTFLEILNLPLNLTVDEILDRLIIYLRKSRKDMDYYKDENIEKTLQRHEKDIQEFIIKILGKPVPEKNIYREVVSGDTIDDRPIIQKVLSLIENPKYIGVICIEIERLARGNTIDQGIIAQTFKYTKTKIITPYKIYNLDNDDDLSYFEDGLFQARKYLTYTKKILNRGRLRSVKEGKYVGSTLPYGYNKIKLSNEKGYVLVENENESKIVKLIADLFLNSLCTTYTLKNGDNISKISKLFGITKKNIISPNLKLKVGNEIKITIDGIGFYHKINYNDTLENIASMYCTNIQNIHIPNDFFKTGEILKIEIKDMGITNIAHYLNYLNIQPRKSKEWSTNMIRNILQSYSIYGYLTWNRRKTTKTLVNGKITKKRPNNEDFLLIKGKHKAILDEQTKIAIEEKFKQNSVKTVPKNKEIKNPLVNLVKCGYCGSNMTRRPYSVNENSKPVKKRVYEVDKNKLRITLRNHKKDYSLNDIALKLKISKRIVEHWFASQESKFSIPKPECWYKLKELLNIETDEFDKAITTFEENNFPHQDTLICSKLRCKCVGSDLILVEKRLLAFLKNILEEYKTYVDNYEESIKKEICSNKEQIEIIEKEIVKIKKQIEKACDLVETGAYTQDLFIKRTKILNEKLDKLQNQKTEFLNHNDFTKSFKNKKKSIPIIEKILTSYNDELTAIEKNELLKLIIKNVTYEKEKGGRYLKDNFKLKIELKHF